MIRQLLAVFFAAFLFFGVYAGEEGPVRDGKLSGVVMDSASRMPVEFANIALYNAADSSLITGGITDENGNFELKDLPDGNYYLMVQYIGYEKLTIGGIHIAPNQRRIDLGNINLGTTAIQLEEAEVVAKKSYTEYKLDRKVINVDQDISNTGASAAQVLEKSPSVRVDIEGNVTLRGSSNFMVFIDGKPSVLDGQEALQQIPANTIENIEIITNPSVKFDPDGTSGIININLKKNRLQGFSGIMDLTVGTGDKYAADLYLNYKTGKFNIYGGIDWNDRNFTGNSRGTRETYTTDTTSLREGMNDLLMTRFGLNFKGGIDYYVTDKTTLSVGGEYGTGGFGYANYRKVHDFTDPASVNRYFIDDNTLNWDRNFYSYNAGINQQFKQAGHELKFFAFYSKRDGSQNQDKQETDTDKDWVPITSDPYLVRSTEEGPSDNLRLELDYVKPVFDNAKFEAGYHYRLDYDDESSYLDYYDYTVSDWVTDEEFSKQSIFERSIHAMYGIFNHEVLGFQYQVGLRGEYTYRSTKVNTGENALLDRFDYFPSVHISKSLNEVNQLMASYSRRIDRPRGYYLEPFVMYIDESTRRMGNPNLLPEYTDSYELGYLRAFGAGSVSIEGYYRNTTDKITRITQYDQESGYFINTFENLNEEKFLGVESSFIYDITKWFNLNLSGNYYYYRLDDLTGEDAKYRSSNNWDARVVTAFKFPTNTAFQINFAYNSPSITAQGRTEGVYFIDLTLRQEFFKRALGVTLKLADVFATNISESWSYGTNFTTYEYRQREPRVFTVTLSYRINNFKKTSQYQSTNVDDGAGM